MSFAVLKALWIRKTLQEMKWKEKVTTIGDDNQGTLRPSSDEIQNERNKHIDVKFYFIRDHLERGTAAFNYVPTGDMIVNIMTKTLCRIKHNRFKTMTEWYKRWQRFETRRSVVIGVSLQQNNR